MARNLAREDGSAGTESEAEQYTDTNDTCGCEAEQAGKALLNRRNYLRLGAATAAAVVGAGAATSATAADENYGMNFDRVVDAVDDLGWDPSGNEPVTASLQENMQSGTLIELPPGTYLVDDTVSENDLVNWGIRGTGSDKGDARFVVPQGKSLRLLQVGRGSSNVLVENLTFDMYDTWETCIGNAFLMDDNLVVKDVRYDGATPSEHTGATALLPLYVFDPDGVAILDGIEMTGPSELAEYPENPLAVFSGAETEGTIYIRNSKFANRGEHAIYASRCVGDVRIENCWFKNNQNTHARISGDGSYARNSVFVWDNDNHPNKGEFQAQTGLTLEGGFQGFTGGEVSDCTFICKSSAPNSGCLKIDGSNGGAQISNCDFQIDAAGAPPIYIEAPGDSHMIDGNPDKPWDVDISNVHIHGSGTSKWNITGALEVAGRDGSVLSNCCIDMEGDRDGVYFANMVGDVADSNLKVPGEAIALENADANTSNITHSSCDHVISEYDPVESDGSTSDGSTDDGSTDDGTSDSDTTYANDVTIIADAGVDTFAYEFRIDGKAALVTDGEYPSNPGGDLGEHVVENDDGTVSVTGMLAAKGGDTFSYEGAIVGYTIGGPATVKHNGEVVDPDSLVSDGSTDDSTSDGSTDDGSTTTYGNKVTIIADAGVDAFAYRVRIDGKAALVTDGEYPSNPGGDLGEHVVENDDGTVSVTGMLAASGGDSFTYEGDVVDYEFGGPVTVQHNGEVVDPELLITRDTVRVIAKQGASQFAYEFDVSNDAALIATGEDAAESAEENVTQNDDGTVTVSGVLADGEGDSFRTDGEITAFRTDGNPVVYRNGERFDWAKLGLTRVLTIEGENELASYSATVTGTFAPNPDLGSINSEDSISGGTAEGAVHGGTDSYLFSGAIADFRMKGQATVLVDGVEVDPADLGLGNRLEIVGTGEKSSYGLTVDGELAGSPETFETEDVIDGTTASGTVTSDVDTYLFSGSITAFEQQGSAAVYLNGQQVDPAKLTSSTDAVLANQLTIRGAGKTSNYSFDIAGNVEKAPDLGKTEAEDTITVNGDVETAAGSVADDDDGYRFSGTITSMSIDGSASITFADLDG